jgi:small nuclear ribonucleoprotein (snRNP)-like protein
MLMCADCSIRGSLDAYIRAFDRHFNMLLTDVDEEYITNAVKPNLDGALQPSVVCI